MDCTQAVRNRQGCAASMRRGACGGLTDRKSRCNLRSKGLCMRRVSAQEWCRKLKESRSERTERSIFSLIYLLASTLYSDSSGTHTKWSVRGLVLARIHPGDRRPESDATTQLLWPGEARKGRTGTGVRGG